MFYKIKTQGSAGFILLRYEPFIDKFLVVYRGQIFSLEKRYLPPIVSKKIYLKAEWTQRAISIPTNVQLQITKACNYKCSFCYADSKKLNIYQLSNEKVKEIVNKLYSWGVCNIQFVGGEVFLRKDFSDVVDYTSHLGMGQSIITNGLIPSVLIDKYSNTLKKFNRIQISINGFSREYDLEVGIAIWDKFNVALKRIIEIFPDIIISFVISYDNHASLPKIVRLCRSYGVKTLRIGIMAPTGRSKARVDYVKYFVNLSKIKKLIKRYYDGDYPLRIEDQTSCSINHDNNLRLPIDILVSPEGRDTLFISVDGSIYPFPWLEMDEFYLGNVFKDDIKKIWIHSELLKKFRSITPPDSVCNGCDTICGLWSRSLTYLWTGSLDGKLPCYKYGFTR